MKTILMEQTVLLKYKTQEEINKLFEDGFKLKQVKNIQYLIKDEIL